MFKKKINKKNTRILIIPPDHSFGSFGDQAMILSALNVIKSNFTSIDIALFAMNKFYGNNLLKDLGYNNPIYSPDEILEQKNFFEYLCNYFDTVFIIGADILDGGCGIGISKNYFDIIQIAYKKNLKIVINGFSFNDRNYPEIIKLIKKISKLAILNVRDAVRAYFMLLTVNPIGGEYYNIGGQYTCKVSDMLNFLISLSPMKDQIKIEVDPERLRPIDADLQVPNTDKFTKHSGWVPEIPFEQTMTDLLNYWRERINKGERFLQR